MARHQPWWRNQSILDNLAIIKTSKRMALEIICYNYWLKLLCYRKVKLWKWKEWLSSLLQNSRNSMVAIIKPKQAKKAKDNKNKNNDYICDHNIYICSFCYISWSLSIICIIPYVLGIYCNLRQTKIKLKKETTTILKNQKNKCGTRNLF